MTHLDHTPTAAVTAPDGERLTEGERRGNREFGRLLCIWMLTVLAGLFACAAAAIAWTFGGGR